MDRFGREPRSCTDSDTGTVTVPSLRGLLERERRLNLDQTAAILGQVALQLDGAHASGLVRGDVRPETILFDGERAFLGAHRRTRWVDGPMGYVAPERIGGRRVDGRADVYALACVAYECLAGRPPHPRTTEAGVLFAHLSEHPIPLSDCRDDLHWSVEFALARALDKDPARRHPTCSVFMLELEGYLPAEAAA